MIRIFGATCILHLQTLGIALARIYSNALHEMRKNNVRLKLDALVFSEYLNRYCRIEWNALYKDTYSNFKDFRKSEQFPSVGNGAVTYARSILRLTERGSQPFEAFDVEHVLTEFEWGEADVIDGLLTESCRCNGWKLVTHDADFTWGGIEILTLNKRLVAACS